MIFDLYSLTLQVALLDRVVVAQRDLREVHALLGHHQRNLSIVVVVVVLIVPLL